MLGIGITSSGQTVVSISTSELLLVEPKVRASLWGQRSLLTLETQWSWAAEASPSLHVGQGCSLLQGPTGPKRQFYGISGSAFGPCPVLGCQTFPSYLCVGARSQLWRSTLTVQENAAGQGKKICAKKQHYQHSYKWMLRSWPAEGSFSLLNDSWGFDRVVALPGGAG